MISFRYHVVSLVAVLLALATGIVLGGGPLQRSDISMSSQSGRAEELAAARARAGAAERGLAFADAYALATADALVERRLARRAVTLVRLPGAEQATIAELTGMVERAGGAVTARVSFGNRLLDVANRQLVAELATQMHGSAERVVKVPAGASGYERLALLVAHAVASARDAGAAVDNAGESILAGVSTARLVSTQGKVERRGSVVLLVAGAPYGTADQRDGAARILGTMVGALDARSDGVVVTGPAASAAGDGLLGALRADPQVATRVSTVDVAERVAGAVVAVLALAEQAGGATGHYGSLASADGPVPSGSVEE